MPIFAFILSMLLSLTAFSQTGNEEVEAQFITRIHFKTYSGGVVVLKAKFENIPDSLNFLLDSGSGGASLDSSTVMEFNIPTQKTDSTIRGLGGVRQVRFAFNKKIFIGGLTVDKLNFHINDYSLLSSVYGEKIDGLLGFQFFNRYIIKIDYDHNYMDVYSKGKFTYPKKGYLLKPVFTSIPMHHTSITDRSSFNESLYMDSGAGLSLLLSEKFVTDSSFLDNKRVPVSMQGEGMNGKIQMSVTVIKKLKIGPYSFKNVPTYIYNDPENVLSYPFTVGLFGNELMRRFNVTYNYGKKEIHIVPNTKMHTAFDYSYTGFSIYSIDGKILVEEVIPRSPADKSGFKPGDEIIGVGTNFKNDIQEYKDLLNVESQEIRVVIRRGKDYKLIILKTGSILNYGKKLLLESMKKR